MQRYSGGFMVAGLTAMAVGLLGLLSRLLQQFGVEFVFTVAPWYGPVAGGALLAGIGWLLRPRSPQAG